MEPNRNLVDMSLTQGAGAPWWNLSESGVIQGNPSTIRPMGQSTPYYGYGMPVYGYPMGNPGNLSTITATPQAPSMIPTPNVVPPPPGFATPANQGMPMHAQGAPPRGSDPLASFIRQQAGFPRRDQSVWSAAQATPGGANNTVAQDSTGSGFDFQAAMACIDSYENNHPAPVTPVSSRTANGANHSSMQDSQVNRQLYGAAQNQSQGQQPTSSTAQNHGSMQDSGVNRQLYNAGQDASQTGSVSG